MGSAEESLVLVVWAHFSEKPAGVGGEAPDAFWITEKCRLWCFLKKKKIHFCRHGLPGNTWCFLWWMLFFFKVTNRLFIFL